MAKLKGIHEKYLAQVEAQLNPGEQVVAITPARLVFKAALLVLTDERVIIVEQASALLNRPRYAEIQLEHVLTAEIERAQFGEPKYVLVITSRTGTYQLRLDVNREAKREAASWPSLILNQQAALDG